MIWLVRILISLSLIIVIYQDFKERKVWAFLLPVIAGCGCYLFFQMSTIDYFLLSIAVNFCIVSTILGILYLISKFLLKKRAFYQAIGLGDILFFLAIAVSFPTVSFLNFFVFAILFTFVLSFILKRLFYSAEKTIPLAGSMSIFILIVYLIHWFGFYHTIYLM